ncbi:uncharacterized protein LOC124493518 [Dermatophagoides farinae]|uniref:uncharacterized protein LOC124493518 n=1 Tax=Dermatophagoides farinae TaxID=6954 RepID=UPI003F5EBDFD
MEMHMNYLKIRPVISIFYTAFNNFMQRFYYFSSIMFLSSYSPKKFDSIYDYYMSIYALKTIDNDYSAFTFPIRERIRFTITVFITFYYSTLAFEFIDYPESIRFIVGDVFVILVNISEIAIIHLSFLLIFCIIMLWFTSYYTYNCRKSLEFRTMIQCWNEIDHNNRILFTIPRKFSEYSLSTLILFDYGRLIIRKNFSNYKYSFIYLNQYAQPCHLLLSFCIQFFKFNNISLRTRQIWQIICQTICFHLYCISINLFIIFYMPIFLGCFTFISLMKISKQLIRDIDNCLAIYQSNIIRSRSLIKIVQQNRIETRLIHSFSLYTRLIVLIECIQKYASKLILLALITGFISSQFTLHLINQMTNGQFFFLIMLYYMLIVEYSVLILLMFIISKFNQQMNQIQSSLQKTAIVMNDGDNGTINFKLQIMNFYERIIHHKTPWGMRIGPTAVLTKFVFIKLIIFYGRFTMLSSKLFV